MVSDLSERSLADLERPRNTVDFIVSSVVAVTKGIKSLMEHITRFLINHYVVYTNMAVKMC